MWRKILVSLALSCVLGAIYAIGAAQSSQSVLEAAIKNMGEVNSVQYSGSGSQFALGQSVSPTVSQTA